MLPQPQTEIAALLEEKKEAGIHAAEAERLLDEARAAASKAEGKVSTLEAELRNAASQTVVDLAAYAREKGAAAEEARTEALQVRRLTVQTQYRYPWHRLPPK